MKKKKKKRKQLISHVYDQSRPFSFLDCLCNFLFIVGVLLWWWFGVFVCLFCFLRLVELQACDILAGCVLIPSFPLL